MDGDIAILRRCIRKRAVRGIKIIVALHDALDIAQLQLVDAVELLDDLAVLVPVVGSAGAEGVEVGGRGGGLRGESDGGGRRMGRIGIWIHGIDRTLMRRENSREKVVI